MNNNISKKFTFGGLLIFSFPSIIMMIFMSLYTIIDGFFVSRFVSSDALSAINIAYPAMSVVIAIGVMLATGGSAIVSRKIGEKNYEEANSIFSFIFCIVFFIGLVIALICFLFSEQIVKFLGADGVLIKLSSDYLKIIMVFSPISALQLLFQSFFVTAGKPNLGLFLTIIGGIFNIIFDYIFIVVMNMGIVGAAYATSISYFIPAIGGLVFFYFNKKGLSFKNFKFNFNILFQTIINGSSEMVTHISESIITFLFNVYMLKFAGSDGVAAITTALYVEFLMNALFLGFTIGVAPVISYNYGAKNNLFLKEIIKKCIIFVFVFSIIIFIVSFIFSDFISIIFFIKDTNVYNISSYGLKVFAISFVFSGSNIFVSGIFTALENGKISAIISFSNLFFTLLGILLLSFIFEIKGLWISIPFAEFLVFIMSFFCISILKTKYNIF